jgi:hypothetical protein
VLPTVALRTPLFEAIPHRQITGADFDGQPLSSAELRLLEAAGSGPGVRVHLLTCRQAIGAVCKGDGLFSACTGKPSLPTWLGCAIFPLVLSERKENERYTRQIRSSAGIAVFVSQRDDQWHWIEAGRAFQRCALQATALGVRTSHLNQPVEVAPIRAGFGRFLGLAGGRPDLVIRFGRGPLMPRSLRRPVDAVLV